MTTTLAQPQEDWVPEESFATRLRLLRFELGRLRGLTRPVSVEEIAEWCDLHPATWSTWENGSSPRQMHAVVAQIAAATGVDRDWLMWGLAQNSPFPMTDKWDTPFQLGLAV